MKTIAKFTDDQLIEELRKRKYVISIWSINDVNQVIDDIREDEEEYKNLYLSDYRKIRVLKYMFEDNDKSDDFEGLRTAIIEAYNEINDTQEV